MDEETTVVCNNKHREITEHNTVGISKTMIRSDMFKDKPPEDTQDEIVFEYTEECTDSKTLDILFSRWLTGDF